MAWLPSTDFEEAVIDLQPEHDFILGQLQYEAKQKTDYEPRPKAHVEFALQRNRMRQQRQEVGNNCVQSTDIGSSTASASSSEVQAKLAMMERIQRITGTKKLGEHAKLEDWEDERHVPTESIAIMRHYGMSPIVDGGLDPEMSRPVTVQTSGIYVVRNGRRRFPLLLDGKYFEAKPLVADGRLSASSNDSSQRSKYTSSYYSHLNEDLPKVWGNINYGKISSSNSSSDKSGTSCFHSFNDKSFSSSPYTFGIDSGNEADDPDSANSYKKLFDTSCDSCNANECRLLHEHEPLLDSLKHISLDDKICEDKAAPQEKKRIRRRKRKNQKERMLSCRQLYEIKNS